MSQLHKQHNGQINVDSETQQALPQDWCAAIVTDLGQLPGNRNRTREKLHFADRRRPG